MFFIIALIVLHFKRSSYLKIVQKIELYFLRNIKSRSAKLSS